MYHQKFKKYGSINVFIWNSNRCQFGNWFVARNQQADEQSKRDVVKIRVLKNRLTGFTGLAGAAIYDHESGRLNPLETSYEGE